MRKATKQHCKSRQPVQGASLLHPHYISSLHTTGHIKSVGKKQVSPSCRFPSTMNSVNMATKPVAITTSTVLCIGSWETNRFRKASLAVSSMTEFQQILLKKATRESITINLLAGVLQAPAAARRGQSSKTNAQLLFFVN